MKTTEDLYVEGLSDPIRFGSLNGWADVYTCKLCENPIPSEQKRYHLDGNHYHLGCARDYSMYCALKEEIHNLNGDIFKLKEELELQKNKMNTFEWTTIPKLEEMIEEAKELFCKGGGIFKEFFGRD